MQLSREYFDMRMDVIKDDVCHPMAGIYSDEDWKEFKDMCDADTVLAFELPCHGAKAI
jgi:hypothetical protein